MCGICGIIDYNKVSRFDEEVIRRMAVKISHRGPDDEGVYVDSSKSFFVGLGHRRLKIIDLSSAGHQPMSNEDQTVWIVLNGEVYNYLELKDTLIKKGHKFKSNTDTEVAIHLYEEQGADFVKYLRGMFALALWDQKNNTLILARDRLGKKPLLYCYKDLSFCFSSEFCSILESGLISREINKQALDFYLSFGYIPAPLTIYQDILKLPPAHILILRDSKVTLKRYWDLDYSKKLNISEEEAQNELIRQMKEAVKIRLYSDVPLGAFLSGGIDSSTVVAMMSELSGKKVKTFSIGFDENDFNELGFARKIAHCFATEHHEFIVRPRAVEILPLLIERYGEPYADSSCIPTYYVSKETRQYVTVALNGDGGDELFGGYDRYQAMIMAENYRKIPAFFRNVINGLNFIIPDSVESKSNFRKLKRFLKAAMLPRNQRYLKWISIFDNSLKQDLYSDDFLKSISLSSSLGFISSYLDRGFSLVDSLVYADTMTYLPYDLLVKVDIASMANSLEGRSPFLDHKVVEFAASLPGEYKVRGAVKKYILKKAIKELIPPKNIHRSKMGFGVPIGKWFRGELKTYVCEHLLSDSFLKRNYFKKGVVKEMVKSHIDGRYDYTSQLWTLLMLELWHRRFID